MTIGKQDRTMRGSRRLQLPTQGIQCLPQARTAEFRIDFRPEQFQQFFSGMRTAGKAGEISQQRRHALVHQTAFEGVKNEVMAFGGFEGFDQELVTLRQVR